MAQILVHGFVFTTAINVRLLRQVEGRRVSFPIIVKALSNWNSSRRDHIWVEFAGAFLEF